MYNTIESFDDLLTMAHAQTEVQRLLFVFARAELDVGHTEAQAENFAEGNGGHLATVMCVDKPLEELTNFTDLVIESQKTEQAWSVVFVGCLSGRDGKTPSSSDANKPLDAMIAAINGGIVHNYLAFDRKGDLLVLEPH